MTVVLAQPPPSHHSLPAITMHIDAGASTTHPDLDGRVRAS
jgi:hypothetical protein